ncbi:serine hydrolase [Microvirga terricola]|uniref:D-alanyl-D-alanine carboxypeptidase n=1 Tax=Microvirga terricola TaxID=2719797 RepID=A0ABX0VG61_9HYPH|nr:serine hydrolase [Microvirga terricola]NIX77730.1 D-alanyl-D-alanine carboxypeptidase [Microvirga terricola]
MNSVWVGRGKALAFVGIAASLAIVLASPAEAARRKARHAGGSYTPPTASLVVDAKTGKVLEAENADALRHPASITKVMTLYLLFEQLERGKLTLNSELRISANAARQAPSKLGLSPGSTIEVEDAIKALVTKSANDIAVAVAENLAGTEQEFAEQMTRKARALGMTKTVYRNASGLPNPGQVTTARDLVTLGRAIQDRFPKYYPYFSTHVFNFDGASHRNHNRLLGRVEGVDGIKTGFVNASGFNVLTNVKTENRHLVAVVLGGRSAASRDNTMAALIEDNLPQAYAGLRTAPLVTENGGGARPVVVADASPAPAVPASATTETTAAAEPAPAPPAAPARKPLDLNSLRPVVASATGASSTTTPSSAPAVRWQKGADPLPLNTQAYAPLPSEPAMDQPTADQKAALQARIEAKMTEAAAVPPPAPPAPIKTAALKVEAPKAEIAEPKKPTITGWIIQLGATDDEAKAKAMLDSARSRVGKLLAKASPFTEKVTKDGSTLYRARFSGFPESDDAEQACKALKKSGFACFASRG